MIYNISKAFKILFFLLFFPISAFSIILEESFTQETNILSGKRLGYYIGSFDPLHKSHEQIVKYLLDEKICDYVLIYPSWGGDSYKNRSNLSVRLEMLFTIFSDHPNVIVTKYNPKKLQNFFVNLGNRYSNTEGLEKFIFYGVIGSDTALKLTPDQEASDLFMSGISIGRDYESHTWGGNIAIGVESFFVFKRDRDDLSVLDGEIGGRKIIEISIDDSKLSSTLVRDMVKRGQNIEDLVDRKISDIINKYSLYTTNISKR